MKIVHVHCTCVAGGRAGRIYYTVVRLRDTRFGCQSGHFAYNTNWL